MAVVSFAPSSNPSYAGILHRSMIRVSWEVSPAQTVTVWKNFGTNLAVQVGGSTTTGLQNVWVRDVQDGDVFSLVDHASESVLSTFTETVTQVVTTFSGSFSNWATPSWSASHSYAVGDAILDINGDIETVATAGISGSSAPTWAAFVTGGGATTSDGTVVWNNSGPPTAATTMTGNLTWSASPVPTAFTTTYGLPASLGLWTSANFFGTTGRFSSIYGPPAETPFTGGASESPFPFAPPNNVYTQFLGPIETSGTLDLGVLNRYGPDVLLGWVNPGARFYLTWTSQDAVTAVSTFSDAGIYFTAGILTAPNNFVDSFQATPNPIVAQNRSTGSTTLNWKTSYAKVAILYGYPNGAPLIVSNIPNFPSGSGNLVGAFDMEALGKDTWQIDLSEWVPNGALFLLYDASDWNIEDLIAAENRSFFLADYLRASVSVEVIPNSNLLLFTPNVIDAVSGTGSSTLAWLAPDSTTVVVRKNNPTTGPVAASGSNTGSQALTNLVNGQVFYLLDGASGAILSSVSIAVRPTPASFTASPNPVPVSGDTYSTTLSWSGGTTETRIRADDPLAGLLVFVGTASGTHDIDQTVILNGRVFFATDTTGKVLSQVVVTLLYTGSNPTVFGIPIPDPVTALAALGTDAPVFPVDPDYAFQKGRSWKTNVLQFAPNLVKQSYILDENPEISFDIGLAMQKGSLRPGASTTTKFRKLYAFYLQQKGSAIGFYFYDPRPWGEAQYTPVNYREDPTTRLTSPGGGVNPSSSTGLFIMWFAEDSLNFERFALLLTKSQLKLVGQAASYGRGGSGGGVVTTLRYSISGAISGISSPASLSVSGMGAFSTNADGTFLIPGLTPGSYILTPSLPGNTFSPASSSVLVSGASVAGVAFAATAGGGVGGTTYQLAGTISGLGGSVASVSVSGTGGSTVSTDTSGNYMATGLSAGSHTVTPALSGFTFSPTSQGVTVFASNVSGVGFVATATGGGGGVSAPAWIPSGYSLVYAEEFNGTSLPSPWQRGYYFSNTVPSSQVTVSGGALHLTWQSGGVPDISVSSSQTFHYGYFEVRMKWTVSNGAWPAFWFIPAQSAGSHTGEIDVFEGQGNDNQAFFATLHEWNGSSQIWQSTPNRFPVSTDFSAYHTYGLLWEPGGNFTWYFDGAVIHTYTGAPSIFDTQSVFPILSMQEGNNWNVGNMSGVTATSLTNDIDYFRVFQHP